MRTQSILLGVTVILLTSAGIGVLLLPRPQPSSMQTKTIANFDECVADGNPVMESFPRQCNDKAGNHFTETLPKPSLPVSTTTNQTPPDLTTMITVTTPTPQSKVSNPLTVVGKARGYWFFEASFPVSLVNASGTVIAQGVAQAEDDWMTEDFVPFMVTLSWASTTPGEAGSLRLKRDNPSGLPSNDAELVIPVTF